MKKIVVFSLCAVMALSLAACGGKADSSAPQPASVPPEISFSSEAMMGETVQIPNPFVECETLGEAEKLAGFSISVPEKISDQTGERLIQAVKDDLIEVIYHSGEEEVRIRKAPGSEDISGDHNEYAESADETVDDLRVTMRGEGGLVRAAFWTDGDFSFSITSSQGLSREDAAALVRSVQ